MTDKKEDIGPLLPNAIRWQDAGTFAKKLTEENLKGMDPAYPSYGFFVQRFLDGTKLQYAFNGEQRDYTLCAGDIVQFSIDSKATGNKSIVPEFVQDLQKDFLLKTVNMHVCTASSSYDRRVYLPHGVTVQWVLTHVYLGDLKKSARLVNLCMKSRVRLSSLKAAFFSTLITTSVLVNCYAFFRFILSP